MYATVLTITLVTLAVWALTMILFRVLSAPPTNLGLHEGTLAPCPATPNCVCSTDPDPSHQIPPLTFTDSPESAWKRLETVLATQPRMQIITRKEDYFHVECTSLVFRFVDDMEFALRRDEKRIDVRSASRAGRSDLGVNRARVEAIRKAFGE